MHHSVSFPSLLIAAALLPVAGTSAPVQAPASADSLVALPRQPFTLELLDLKRGEWRFLDAFGQRLELKDPVFAWAYPGASLDGLELKYLCCDPEFPESLQHAVLKAAIAGPTGSSGRRFRIDEPCLAASVEIMPPVDGASQCRLSDIRLGPAVAGDRYVEALYLVGHGHSCPLWLAPAAEWSPGVRLLTGRIGNVFTGSEPVQVTLARLGARSQGGSVALEVRDYARGDTIWRSRADVPAGSPGLRDITIPLSRYGVFEVTARAADGSPAALMRVCRIPVPRKVDPDASRFGINLFQMQVWWYAQQAPLMAKAGVHWIRPWLAWENTWASQRPALDRWETRPLDAALRRMDKLGLRYQTILYGAPDWVLAGAPGPAPPHGKMDVWAKYVEELARRFRGRIPYYEIWNEPDLMWPEATRQSARHYADTLKAGYAAIKRADPKARVLGLSHAGYEQWLENVGKLGAKPYIDVATMHTYAEPDDFIAQVERRKELMRRSGMGGVPIWFNEFGTTANDFSPAYSREFACSEQRQAEVLVENYAQALSVGPDAKAFWFCTLDPRDPFHKDQWTGDAGIGVLYLGLLPKLAYSALAGAATQMDGRTCAGVTRIEPGLRAVAFSGQVAVVWAEKALTERSVPATQAGCAPDERIVVRDMLGNKIAAGRASKLRLDLTHGPLYVEGSRELEAALRVRNAAQPDRRAVNMAPRATGLVPLHTPAGATVTAAPDPHCGVATAVRRAPGSSGWTLRLTARPNVERASGIVRVTSKFPKGVLGLAKPRVVEASVRVSVGTPNLVPDGAFLDGIGDWGPERASRYAWDTAAGHDSPGSLRLDGPFNRRLVYWGAVPKPGVPLRLRFWAKTSALIGGRVSANLALFGEKGWLRTWCLASTEPVQDIDPSWRTVAGCGRIPGGTAGWTLVEATLPADLLPAEVTKTAFFIDAAGGGAGSIWFDDIDLWQP